VLLGWRLLLERSGNSIYSDKEYLIQRLGYSYLHTRWVTAEVILAQGSPVHTRAKIKRLLERQPYALLDDSDAVDVNLCEVERILDQRPVVAERYAHLVVDFTADSREYLVRLAANDLRAYSHVNALLSLCNFMRMIYAHTYTCMHTHTQHTYLRAVLTSPLLSRFR
jgi:hypothetical protein